MEISAICYEAAFIAKDTETRKNKNLPFTP